MQQAELRIHKNFPSYGVTVTGRVWSFKSNLWKKPFDNGHGYLRIQLRSHTGDAGYKNIYPHRLVMELFGEDNEHDKRCINHKDGNKQNNHVNNLEWVTHRENSIHAHALGLTRQTGYTHSLAVVTPALATKIKELSKLGWSQRKIAREVSVGNGTVNRVINDNGKYYPITK